MLKSSDQRPIKMSKDFSEKFCNSPESLEGFRFSLWPVTVLSGLMLDNKNN